MYRNRDYLADDVIDLSKNTRREVIDCLYDPQTSGGLLIAVKEDQLDRLQYQLGERGLENAVIGQFKKKTGDHFIEIRD